MKRLALYWLLLGAALLRAGDESPNADVATTVKALSDRAADPKSNKDKLWDDLIQFRCQHPGTSAALRAAELLSQISSPLDKLDPKQIPDEERVPWMPKETVAIIGTHRGKQWGSPYGLVVTGDGSRIFSSDEHNVYCWEAATLRLLSFLNVGAGAFSLYLTPDDQTLIGNAADSIKVWDVRRLPPLETFSMKGASGTLPPKLRPVSVSPDGKYVLVFYSERAGRAFPKQWKIFEIVEGKLIERAAFPDDSIGETIFARAVSEWVVDNGGCYERPGGQKSKCLRLWRWRGAEIEKFGLLPDTTTSQAFARCTISPDGKTLAAVSGGAKEILIFSLEGPTPILTRSFSFARPGNTEDLAKDMVFSPDSQLLLVAAGGKSLRFLPMTLKKAQELKVPEKADQRVEVLDQGIERIRFLPNGQSAVLVDRYACLHIWDLSPAKWGDRFHETGHAGAPKFVELAPDGRRLLLVGQTGKASWWDLAGPMLRERPITLEGPGQLGAVILAPDGKRLAARCDLPDNRSQLMIGEYSSERLTLSVPVGSPVFAFRSFALSPDSNTLAVAMEETVVKPGSEDNPLDWKERGVVQLWDIGSKVPAEQQPRIYTGEKAGSCKFSPKGDELLVGTNNGALQLWRLKPKASNAAVIHDRELSSLAWPFAYMPDGTKLLLGLSTFDAGDLARSAVSVRRCEQPEYPEVARFGLPKFYLREITVSPDGKFIIAVDSHGQVRVLRSIDGQSIYSCTLPGPGRRWLFTQDSRYLIAVCANNVIYVLRLKSQ